MAAPQDRSTRNAAMIAWRGFAPGIWQHRVERPRLHPAQLHALRGRRRVPGRAPTERTQRAVGRSLQPLLAEEREKGILDVSQVRRDPRARAGLHRQGQRDHRRPADRCAAEARDHALRRLARGGGEPRVLRLQAGPERSARSSPSTARRTTTACSTPTPPTSGRRAPRISSPACRMPMAAAASSATTAGWRSTAWISSSTTSSARRRELDDRHSTEEVIRLREELAEQIRSLKELKEMASSYGYDISGPASNAREAVQWTYFGYLAAIKQQNGAAMSAGRLSTFWDIYFERDLREGTLTEAAGPGDHRRPGHQVAHRALPARARIQPALLRRPGVGHRGGRRHGRGRPHARDQDRVPHAAHALQPRTRARAQPHRVLVAAAARGLQALCHQGVDRHQRHPVRVRRPDAAQVRATTAPSPAASRRCGSASRCSSSARA